MRRALPAIAVGLTLLAVWPPSQSAFHEPKRWLFFAAATLGALLTLPRWKWTALPLVALTALQPWHGAGPGLQALAFAWALAAWPALQPDLRRLTRISGIAAAVVGLVVVLQALGLDVLAFAAPDAETTRLRAYGTLGNPDFVASALLPIAVLLIGSREKKWLLLLLLIVPALVLTRSFATLLSALVAAVLVSVHRRRSPSDPPERSPSVPPPSTPRGANGGLLVMGVLCMLLAVGLLGRDPGNTLAGRRYLVAVALPHVADAPLLGHGLGATVLAWPTWELSYWQARCDDAACVKAHPEGRFAGLQDHLHADWLEWLLERGLPGALALLLALGAPLRASWRGADPFLFAALGAALSRGLVDFPLHRPADLCLLAALVACAQVSQTQPPASSRSVKP
ncbi:MAG: O-antigen ligase family protein [Archangium sp.]|nr:O-antigen ligase family protein [Archangium sp.]